MKSSETPEAASEDFIHARNRRQAMDWSLVLASQGLDGALIEVSPGEFALAVPLDQAAAARSAIEAYRQENRRWRWKRRIPATPLLFHWGSTGWVTAMAVTAALSTRIDGLRDVGVMQGGAVSKGEAWRLLTATMLHGDGLHLGSNLMAGYLFVGVAMGLWGAGVALFSILLAGIFGNLAGWLIYAPGQPVLGASGMVMGAIGLMAVAPSPSGKLRNFSGSLLLRTITPAVLLFALYGFSPRPNTDLIGHIAGFVTGVALGVFWRPWRRAKGTSPALNRWLLAATVAMTAAAWIAAARALPLHAS